MNRPMPSRLLSAATRLRDDSSPAIIEPPPMPTPAPSSTAQSAPSPAATDRARLFLALWPPPAVAAELQARGDRLCADAPVRPEPAERLHLTLHFLGPVPRARLPALQSALCLPFRPFELRLGACVRWPNGVVAAELLNLPPALQQLRAALAQSLVALALPVDSRAFRPHVTLARRHAGPWPAAVPAWPALRWRVRHYVLAESPGHPGHPYRQLQTCRASCG